MTPTFTKELVDLLPRLRRFALSLTGKADESDDLVQATCERALKAHASWEPGTRLDAWLFRIMKNLWIDQIRHRKVEAVDATIDDVPDLTGSDGRAEAEGRLEMADVATAMATLPGDQQTILRLVCIEDLSYRDAAERLGVPIGTVMSRLARARIALAAHLGATRTGRNPTRPGG